MGDVLLYVGAMVVPPACIVALFALARVPRLRSAPNWLRLIVGNLLVMFLLGSILFILAESFYRLFYDTTDSFSQTRVSQRWAARHFLRNNAGARDSENYRFRRQGRPRLTFIGDSFTAGYGIANVDDRFANLIRSRVHGAWEVQVFADPGRNTGDETKLVESLKGDGYEFDRIVLVYCLNDVADIVFPPDPSRRQRQIERPGFLVEHSFLINTFYYHFKAQRDPAIVNYYGFVQAGYEGEVWQKQRQRLRQFDRTVKSAGGRLLVVIFPFVHALGSNYGFRDAHRLLGEVLEEINVPYIDLLPILEPHAPEGLTVNRFDAHPNERAHALAADAILPWLKAQYR